MWTISKPSGGFKKVPNARKSKKSGKYKNVLLFWRTYFFCAEKEGTAKSVPDAASAKKKRTKIRVTRIFARLNIIY